MKQLIIFLFVSGVIYSGAALACPNRDHNNLICPGDSVVGISGWVGNVLAINRRSHKAGVQWHTDQNGYSENLRGTYDIENLAIGLGCVAGYCVGDKVVSLRGWEGTIIGVNPYNKRAGVQWHTDHNGYSENLKGSYQIRDLANAKYCDDYDGHYRTFDSNQYIFDRLNVMIAIRGLPNDYWYGRN